MKHLYKLSIALVLGAILFSCSEDPEPESAKMKGTWKLDTWTFSGLTSGYNYVVYDDGVYLDVSGLVLSSEYGEEEYLFSFSNGTYTRDLVFSDGTESESGSYSLEEDYLYLDPSGNGIGITTEYKAEFTVSQTSEKNLILTASETGFFVSDAYATSFSYKEDSIFWATYDSLYTAKEYNKANQKLLEIGQFLDYDQVYVFDKQAAE